MEVGNVAMLDIYSKSGNKIKQNGRRPKYENEVTIFKTNGEKIIVPLRVQEELNIKDLMDSVKINILKKMI